MADDPDVNRVVRKRTANRSVLKNLLNQGRDIISNTGDKKKTCNDLESLISVIENKFQITKEQELEIVDLIHARSRPSENNHKKVQRKPD